MDLSHSVGGSGFGIPAATNRVGAISHSAVQVRGAPSPSANIRFSSADVNANSLCDGRQPTQAGGMEPNNRCGYRLAREVITLQDSPSPITLPPCRFP